MEEVLFSSGLLLQENSKVQVHWKTYIKYLTMLPALGMQHWPKTDSKLSSIAFLSIIFWRIRKSVYLIIPAPICRVFFITSRWKLVHILLFLKHAEKLSFYRMLKTRTSCSIFKFYCIKFHSSCPEYFVKSKKPQHAAGSKVYKKMNHFSWIWYVLWICESLRYLILTEGLTRGESQSQKIAVIGGDKIWISKWSLGKCTSLAAGVIFVISASAN